MDTPIQYNGILMMEAADILVSIIKRDTQTWLYSTAVVRVESLDV